MDDLNKKLHLAIGGHWHECKHCGDSSGGSLWDRANPRYNSSLEDAFKLVEWMRRERNATVEIDSEGGFWEVWFTGEVTEDDDLIGRGRDESLPRAIALAAARALGGK